MEFHRTDYSNKALGPTDLPIWVGGAGIMHDAYGVRCKICGTLGFGNTIRTRTADGSSSLARFVWILAEL
jgi:hypothetical protein